MKGNGQTWKEYNLTIRLRLDSAITTRVRGEDVYKRWPLDTLEHVRARFLEMQEELDKRK